MRWNQSNELEDLQQSLRGLATRSQVRWRDDHGRAPQWVPLVDVSEDARGYVLRAELPQVKENDAKITMEDGTLTIAGNRRFDRNSKKDRRVEHAYGRFAHSFTLPEDARPARVTAVFKDGLLTVHLTKNDKVSSRPARSKGSLPDTVGQPTASHLRCTRPETYADDLNNNENNNENKDASVPGHPSHQR